MADSLNVSALAAYTDQIGSGLAKEILLNANTLKGDLVSIKYGVVGDKTALNVLKHTMYAVAGGCGTFTSTGSTTLAQPVMQMCPIKFEQSICLNTLKDYWYDWYMAREYNTESLGKFEDVFVSGQAEATSLAIDKMIWQGAKLAPNYAGTGATTGNNTLCDGFLAVGYINSASTVNVAKSAFTQTTAIQIVDTIVDQISANAPVLLEECNLYLNPADFQTYLKSLRALNLFHYEASQKDADVNSIHHPGSIGLTVKKVNGMTGLASGYALATRKDNIWLGLSAESDLNFDLFYDKLGDDLKTRCKLKLGVQFYQPELLLVIR